MYYAVPDPDCKLARSKVQSILKEEPLKKELFNDEPVLPQKSDVCVADILGDDSVNPLYAGFIEVFKATN